ncbi:hypothetical protein RHSIM_RhsimUnG0214100 [Rhododendron simsii]|uniref:BHLH domain-containing protein n=1 Tax=Rhododendron simsii TaxID=118357 RepID=A0A834FU72_RHOSS|nr:hypothetical protein RHSIM_RhsimUnG0214100 [Rhododendron simsii]
MGTEKKESILHKGLERLCLDNGWSYGVFWRFDQRNSLLLTMEDAYYEEQMGVFVDNMLLRVHMLGNGAVGQAAFNKRHRWMFSDAHFGGQIPLGSLENQDLFQDNSDIHCQFSSGIETIAVISVEPHGVAQFGSINKIPETMEFVDQARRLFQEIENGDTFVLPENMPSSSNSGNCGPNGLFASLISSGDPVVGNPRHMHTASSRDYMEKPSTSTDLPRLSPFNSSHRMTNSSNLGNQLHMVSTSTPLKLSNKSNTWLQEPLAQSTCFAPSGAPSPCISTWSSGQSTVTSIEQQLPSQSRLLGDCIAALKNPFPVDNFSPQILSSPEQRNSTVAVEVSSVSSSLNEADVFGNIPFNHPSNTVQSFATNTFTSGAIENDLFESLGVDIDFIQAEGFLDDILMPGGSGGVLDFGADTSECISEQRVNTAVGPQETLFSKLGLNQFLDGIACSSNSIASTSFEDELSSGSKRKTRSCSLGGGNMMATVSKSETGSWVGDSYSITYGSKHRRPEESVKVGRKKARPGSRPKPKDRQQIQDRIAELRKLIPNGLKMSIDTLLAQTIKHMLFLQSVTNHAENLKQAEERKVNEPVLRENSCSSGYNVMWATEVGALTMVDPVDVKDLRIPGQKLIQMLCEEKGFFLEIVDIIQGFGLTILKGVMEVRKDKIWACFIVEAEAKRHVTKQQIYLSLHQLLYQKASSDQITVTDQLANVLNGGTTMFNNYHQPPAALPTSFAGLEDARILD